MTVDRTPPSLSRDFSWSGKHLFWTLLGILITASIVFDATILDLSTAQPFGFLQGLGLPLVFSLLATMAAGSQAVPVLRQLKTGQIIREEGPQSHHVKAGTPTMGGVFFIPTAITMAGFLGLFSGWSTASWLQFSGISALTLAYGWLGWLDDWQVLQRKSNKGISPKTKLVFQFGFGIIFALWLFLTQPGNLTNLLMPGGWLLPLGILFWPLVSWVLATASNATNLTDGLDGLAGGTSAIAFLAMGAIVAPTNPALGLFCAACTGACLGFLAFNRNPAKVFMGDTGSLALGAALAGVALMTQNLWSAVIISGVFLVETLSVVLQVSYYKATKGPDGKGKRLFKMSPLHHHFELSGWSELQVVGTFYAAAGVLAIAALVWR